MELKSLLCTLILAASVLPSFADNPIDWVKATAGAIVAKLAHIKGSNTRHYLRGYDERVPGIVYSGSAVIHGTDDFLPNDLSFNGFRLPFTNRDSRRQAENTKQVIVGEMH